MRKTILALLCAAGPALADGEPAGEFDYYILALGWSPTWCALAGDARGADQCDERHDYSFTLHGLWPQNELGWPSYCNTRQADASRAETAAMADIMGSAGLAWHEWKKHGRCSGLPAADYFALSRQALAAIDIPDLFETLDRDIRLPASVVEDAFIEANPALERNMITVICAAGHIGEVRICLSRDLEPRACGEDAIRDCRMTDAVMARVR
jgi:ribonuclease T2